MASSDGAVPSRPMPPVVYGESSGTVAFPSSGFTIGAAFRLAGAEHLLVVRRDILEQREQIDLLLVMHADEVVVGLSGECKHRRAIEFCVVEAVQQMDRARSGSCEADAELAGVLCIAGRHERRGFLVTNLDERNALLSCAERLHDAVDPVTRRPKTTRTPQSIKRSTRMSAVGVALHLHGAREKPDP